MMQMRGANLNPCQGYVAIHAPMIQLVSHRKGIYTIFKFQTDNFLALLYHVYATAQQSYCDGIGCLSFVHLSSCLKLIFSETINMIKQIYSKHCGKAPIHHISISFCSLTHVICRVICNEVYSVYHCVYCILYHCMLVYHVYSTTCECDTCS